MLPNLFVFGLGFSARVIAKAALAQGWRVAGTTRTGEVVGEAQSSCHGLTVYPFDRDRDLPPQALDGVSHILSSVPPDAGGDPVLDRLAARLRQAAPHWVGYLSTTGVYGDCDGAWVDEATPPNPSLERSCRRLAAEQNWLGSGLPVHLFRLAGIYGPGRSAIDSVRNGTARRVVKPGQVFSRIHVDDIAQVVLASAARPDPGAIYNVCDDDCAPPQQVVAHACALLGVAAPPEIPWELAQNQLSPMALSFYADNKRVRNDRIKTDLAVSLRYPSYRQGLAAILAAEKTSGLE